MSGCGKCGVTPPGEPADDLSDGEFPGPATNACKLCTPLGACLAFKGFAGTVPFLHGSQGCATYIRRYLISHFREPMDIAASNFAENAAIFGGRTVLHHGLDNVARQYQPALIGIATTCLSETIGENMPQLLHEYKTERAGPGPKLVHVSTPSYRGTHVDGFHTAVRGVVEALAERSGTGATPGSVAILPGFVSAADLREVRTLAASFGLRATLVPDYSDTLDGGSWRQYERIPQGGTTLDEVRALGASVGVIECGRVLAGGTRTAGTHLASLGVRLHRLGLPIGLRESDRFCAALAQASGGAMPAALAAQRGRFIDAMVDGHKYVSARRAVVFGEEDFVIGLTSFLCEIGVDPVVCASGGRSRCFAAALRAAVPELPESAVLLEGADFAEIEAAASSLKPDLLVGNSKGYGLARRLDVPLLRCGFPIHDRLGGHRLLHLGYAGATQLYDSLVNLLLTRKQESSPIGYSYL